LSDKGFEKLYRVRTEKATAILNTGISLAKTQSTQRNGFVSRERGCLGDLFGFARKKFDPGSGAPCGGDFLGFSIISGAAGTPPPYLTLRYLPFPNFHPVCLSLSTMTLFMEYGQGNSTRNL
jgi:hypothetical protein